MKVELNVNELSKLVITLENRVADFKDAHRAAFGDTSVPVGQYVLDYQNLLQKMVDAMNEECGFPPRVATTLLAK